MAVELNEQQTREHLDAKLVMVGWVVRDKVRFDLFVGLGVDVPEKAVVLNQGNELM